MDENTLFRSALNGFKREDVMDYITKTTRQHEAAVTALKAELDESQRQLDFTTDTLRSTQEQLSDVLEQRSALEKQLRDAEAVKAKLKETLEQVSTLENQLCAEREARAADAQAAAERQQQALDAQQSAFAAEQAEAERTHQEALAHYQEDAAAYVTLAQQVGRVMLHAEVSGETMLANTQAEAEAITKAAQEQSAALLAESQRQSETMLAEAHSKVVDARNELTAVQSRAEELFRRSQEQFSTTQDSVNLSVRRAVDQLEELRGLLMDLSDSFSNAEASFEPPVLEPCDEAGWGEAPCAEPDYAGAGD